MSATYKTGAVTVTAILGWNVADMAGTMKVIAKNGDAAPGITNAVQVAFKDISGGELPGISKLAGSIGGEFNTPAVFLGKPSNFFIASDVYYRSSFSSSPSPSAYLNIDGYSIVNTRLGYKVSNGLSFFIWGRNLLQKDYYEQLLPAGGNAGQFAAVLGDPRTYGVTLRYNF